MSNRDEIGGSLTCALSIAGHYACGNEEAGAQVDVFVTGPTSIRVLGRAYWGSSRPFGPNIGLLNLEGSSNDPGVFHLSDRHPGGDEVLKLRLQFATNGLTISEENGHGYFGMNATFQGIYQRQGVARWPKTLPVEEASEE